MPDDMLIAFWNLQPHNNVFLGMKGLIIVYNYPIHNAVQWTREKYWKSQDNTWYHFSLFCILSVSWSLYKYLLVYNFFISHESVMQCFELLQRKALYKYLLLLTTLVQKTFILVECMQLGLFTLISNTSKHTEQCA